MRVSIDRPSFEEINERLDGIIIDCAITDKVGREFWKTEDSVREYILSWPTFARKLWRYLGKDEPNDPDDPLPPPEIKNKTDEKNKWYIMSDLLQFHFIF